MNKKKQLVAMDIECYSNYMLIMFKRFSDGNVLYFEKFNNSKLNGKSIKNILNKYTIVTFNGIKYDRLIVTAGLVGFSNQRIHDVSSYIVCDNGQPWEVRSQFELVDLQYDEIDLIEVAPMKASLKLYAGRLHVRKMQDLPIEPSATILPTHLVGMREYCENDLDDTIALYNALEKAIELRETMSNQYHVDLRSKSDAQIAEAVIKHELVEKYNITPKKRILPPNTSFRYTPPNVIRFKGAELNQLRRDFGMASYSIKDTGHLQLPEILSSLTVHNERGKTELLRHRIDALIGGDQSEDAIKSAIENSNCKNPTSVLRRCKLTIKNNNKMVIPKKVNVRIVKIGGTKYKIGLGGLHSMEESVYHKADLYYKLKEIDVVSYYPFIILVNKYMPKTLGLPFLKIYRSFVMMRLKAVDIIVNGTLKILINGTFGKLASKWSFLYNPDLMMQITITGQLSLLMLIETLEINGITAVSANTDGIVLKIPVDKEQLSEDLIWDWEMLTGYTMGVTDYSALYSRDVNNYVAVKTNGSVKTKGSYGASGLRNNPTNEICKTAVIEMMVSGTPVSETILNCTDITKFVTVRTVKGGAIYDNQFVGKAVRWYYAKDTIGGMYYKTSGNKVPKTDGCKPIMTLPDNLPDDIDYQWYIDEANKMYDLTGASI